MASVFSRHFFRGQNVIFLCVKIFFVASMIQCTTFQQVLVSIQYVLIVYKYLNSCSRQVLP